MFTPSILFFELERTIDLDSLFNTFDFRGILNLGSIIILIGFSPLCNLEVSRGLSSITVCTPTRIDCSSVLHL